MEELLFRHSFLPQRGVHPLLRRVRHQALRGGRPAVLRPARQLRRPVELVDLLSLASRHRHLTTSSSRLAIIIIIIMILFLPSDPPPLVLLASCDVAVLGVTLKAVCSHVDSGA